MGPSKEPMKKSNSAKKIKNSRKTELKKKTTDSPKTKSGKKMEVTAKPSSIKAKSTSVKGGQKKERSKPVIVIKSVDVTESTAEETGKTSKKKEEEAEVRKEMSVEVAPASVYDEEEEEVVEMQKIPSEQTSGSAASSLNDKMASSSFDLATFVTSRLGSINSGLISQVGERESHLVEV